MAFKLNDIIIDRLLYGVAENFDGVVQYVLTQLQEGNISITAESKEARDRDGVLVMKRYTGKAGTFSATNAMLSAVIMEATSGSEAIYADADNMITMPKIVVAKAGTTVSLADYIEGTVKVNAYYTNGTVGQEYALGTTASEAEYVISEDGVLTLPTAADVPQFMIRYQRNVSEGVKIVNRSDKYPRTVRLILKALAVDPCAADTLKACYIEFPSFQVSPEIEINLATDATLDFSGDLQVDYCSADKVLYNFYWADGDEEEE